MATYVDTKKIEEHISILDNELKEINILLELQKAMVPSRIEAEIIKTHIEYLQKERQYVLNRRQILEDIVSDFSNTERELQEKLRDIMEMVNQIHLEE